LETVDYARRWRRHELFEGQTTWSHNMALMSPATTEEDVDRHMVTVLQATVVIGHGGISWEITACELAHLPSWGL
jgi:hypothetical protein